MIRPAAQADLCRIAEILVFNNRLHYYPIFQDAAYSFGEMQVTHVMARYTPDRLSRTWVYDDGVVKGIVQIHSGEVEKLYVEPAFQHQGIGEALLGFAVTRHGARFLWALEKNKKAVAFYRRHGFDVTGERKLEEGTNEYLVLLKR